MSGMPFAQALIFCVTVIVLIIAAERRHLHPFLAIVAVAAAFGFASGFSISFVGKTFGNGFAQTIYSPGLVIVGVGLVTGLAESAGAMAWLTARCERCGQRSQLITALLGLIAGTAASPAAAFVLLTPLLRPIGGATAPRRAAATTTLALALSASHGLAALSPVMIVSASILGASWGRVALFGMPLAIVLAVFGGVLASWLCRHIPETQPRLLEQYGTAQASAWSAMVLIVATFIPLSLLTVQSLGEVPSEPLGGGTSRELVIGVGRPLILMLVGVGIMIAGRLRLSAKLLGDSAWTSRILGSTASLFLIVGAAGGLQKLCQETGMAELLGERVLNWHIGFLGLVLIPFLVAALIKILQGSSLVAAITTAGMVQPLLTAFGAGGTNAKALAALAIGAGAMTASHVNDEFFWLVADRAGLSPLRALRTLTFGTLLQGLAAVVILFLLSISLGGA
jgi:gluconate:H+ symporter, GntP family